MKPKKIPVIKKDIKTFLNREEGKITKKNAVKLGINLAVWGAVFGSATSAQAGCWKTDHSSHASCHSSCHSSCHGSCHSSCHSSHDSCHSSHDSCHDSHDSCHDSHDSCHDSHESCHDSHESCHDSCHSSSHFSHGASLCPFVLVWNGKNFVTDNNILPDSENNILRKNTVIEELYRLERMPRPKDKKYLFKIVEFEKAHSYFYNFELIKIIHPKELNITTVDNKIVGYKNLILPSSIKDKNEKDQTKNLTALNDEVFFGGEEKDILKVRFDDIRNLKNCCLMLRASLRAGYPEITKITQNIERAAFSERRLSAVLKGAAVTVGAMLANLAKTKEVYAKSIAVNLDIYVGQGEKKRISFVHPRERFSTSLIDVSKYIKKDQNSLQLELEWTNTHNLSFIGLVETDNISRGMKYQKIKLSDLKSSEDKNINADTLKDKPAELNPGHSIELEFSGKKEQLQPNQRESFILKSRGYYVPF